MHSTASTAISLRRHHWIIEMPNGPTSQGCCKVCGARREFFNNPEDARIGTPQPATAAA